MVPKESKEHTLLRKTKREAQKLAALLEEAARKILKTNLKLDSCISVINMENKKKQEYLDELVDYQARKEHIYMVIIGYWLITILLGLVAMTLEKQITDVGMYIIWGGLLLSNVLLVIGHRLYDNVKVGVIIDKFSDSEQLTVIANPVSSGKEGI